MPNRIIKESTLTSPNLNKCSIPAQDLYKRILVLVDDYGCTEGNCEILYGKAYCMCMDKVKLEDVKAWRHELVKHELIKTWEEESREYLLLNGVNHLLSYTNDGKPTRHRRKTPIPPFQQELGLQGIEPDKAKPSQAEPDKAKISQREPNPNPNPNPKPNQIRALSDHFCKSYLEAKWNKDKKKYFYKGAKDTELIKKLLAQFTLEELKPMIERFMSSRDEFIQKAGYTIGVFYSQINKLVMGESKSLIDRERRLTYVSRKQPENL